MIAALLLAAAPATAVAAERAFDAAAARDGQWTAFRAYADPGAIMFVPRPTNAQAWLKGRADPAKPVRWQPAASYVACDGQWAVNTGPWQRPDGSQGYFTTVWHRGATGGWRWVLDHGDALTSPRAAPAHPMIRHAACGGSGRTTLAPAGGDSGVGASSDATLRWAYKVAADGARTLRVELWTGAAYRTVIDDRVAALAQMIELFVSSFITFFVVIDPPGCAPIFAGLTGGATPAHRRAMGVRAVGIAAAILLVFALFGQALLHGLGISLASFRIAGGIMLFLIALEMVFERRTQKREDRAAKVAANAEVEDVSIFPMAMPMIAGPGSIASVMLLMAKNAGWEQRGVVLAALAANLVLMLVSLLAAGAIMRVLGAKIEAVITRLLGVLLAALAVQFVMDGLQVSLG